MWSSIKQDQYIQSRPSLLTPIAVSHPNDARDMDTWTHASAQLSQLISTHWLSAQLALNKLLPVHIVLSDLGSAPGSAQSQSVSTVAK